MAVVYKGEHHKNPSGCNNKAKWILSEAKWNKTRAIKLVEQITFEIPKGKQRSSWYIALGIALHMYDRARLSDLALVGSLASFLTRHKNCPHYIKDDISSIVHYIESSKE